MTLIYKYLTFFMLVFTGSYAQVGIGTTTPEAALDVTSTNSGVLVSRVGLTSNSDVINVTNPQGGALVTGTLIWNTATAGTAPNNVVPGFYFWTGSAWSAIGGTTTRDWGLAGNSGTTAGTDFLGTTDNIDLRIKTDNADRFNFSSNGRLRSYDNGILAQPTYSWIGDEDTGLWRPSADVLSLTTGGVNRLQIPATNQIWAMNPGSAVAPFYSFSADVNTGIFSSGTDQLNISTAGVERIRVLDDGRVSINDTAPTDGDLFSSNASATNNYAVNGYNAQTTGSAIYGTNTNLSNSFSAIEGATSATLAAGVFGINSSTVSGARPGVKGESNSGIGNRQIGVQGSYNSAGFGIGVIGIGFNGAVPAGSNDFGVVGWVGNGLNYSGYFNGNHAVANGTKSASVGTSKGNQLLYVTESPEVWFEDIGRAKLVNGEITIKLDPLFLETIVVDEQHPMSVFLQEEGESKGLYVIPGTDGFTVKEKNGGTSNLSFSYRVMAKRLHFQDHRFGNDPTWGDGDTRKYNQYAAPPPVDYNENVRFQEMKKKNAKPDLLPAGFEVYDSRKSVIRPVASDTKE